jgi:signal transduction histidine kinase
MTDLRLTEQELSNILNKPSLSSKTSDNGLSSPFLHLLGTAGRDILSKLMTEQVYLPGQVVFKENDMGDSMYIIWSGRAAVIKGDFQSPTILGYRGPGDIVGEMALLENQPRSASVVALEDLRTLKVTRKDFEEMLSNNPAMGLSILSTLSSRLRAADDARKASVRYENQLIRQLSDLQLEKQQMLELEQLRQDTIALIVHDLRHPISSLFGAIKILEMVLPEAVLKANKQLLNIANLNCEHLQLMVDSLLDVARMEAGETQLKLTAANLGQLILEAIDRTRISTEMENITIHAIIPDDLPPVMADHEKVDRVLSNLLNNAIKYTPVGEQITVVVQTQRDEILVSITDPGPGIPPEDRERIFGRFTQVAENHSRVGGFGLGLAFCRLAVEAHGGRIWVEPGDNDLGSRFNFTLPLSVHAPNHHK